MLKNIKVTNFRAFDEEVNIRIRPITVLIGRNNVGKSTLLKFLLMLQQTVESRAVEFFVTGGRHVNLGSFEENRHQLSKEKQLTFTVEIETHDYPSEQFREGIAEIFRQVKPGDVAELQAELKKALPELAQDDYPPACFSISGALAYGPKPVGTHSVRATIKAEPIFEVASDHLQQTRFLVFPSRSNGVQDLITLFFNDSYLHGIRSEIQAMRHLAPTRDVLSQRQIVLESSPPDDVGHTGEYTMEHLRRIWNTDRERTDFIKKHLDGVLAIDDLTFSAQQGFVTECRAHNKVTGVEVYVGDFGFGVIQCIPVFVQGALLQPGQLFMVEQPEAQVHPTAQLEMGSFFADLWQTRGVPSLIETHSANIILRLRRLIAKKELDAADVSLAYFYVEDNIVKVRNLDIHPDGSLEKGLPMEFFGADVIEALGMRVGK